MAYYQDEATLSDHLIAFLFSARSTRAYNKILYEQVLKRRKSSSVRTTLYRLRRNGLVTNEGSEWKLTAQGKQFYKREKNPVYLPSPFKPKSPDYLLLCFDVPESERKLRDWLRTQLKIFGYRMVQKSLWIGPGPLPKEFNDRIAELKIKPHIKIFNLAKK